MKHLLKKYERMLSIHHYIAVLRRQPVHMQHVYAAVFAGLVTVILASYILYMDYGFWHEKYNRNDEALLVTEVAPVTVDSEEVLSPGEMIQGFFKEASDKFKTVGTSNPAFLEGKDTYTKESVSSEGQ
jgi:uncharacterized membrane protein YraQ (UPF0718 family)